MITVVSTEDMPLDIAHTCALDVIDEHAEGVTREEIAVVTRVTEERTRFYERKIEKKLRAMHALEEWEGHESSRGEGLLAGCMEA